MKNNRKIFIFVGPSASGKTTIEEALIKKGATRWVVSTTREKRKNEVEGVDYNFLSVEEFNKKRENFLHIIEINKNWLYGYPQPPRNKGVILISIINVEPALKLKKILEEQGEDVYIISFQIPKKVRRELLKKRGDKEADIQIRFSREENQNEMFASLNEKPDLIIKSLKNSQQIVEDFIRNQVFKNNQINYFYQDDLSPEEVKRILKDKGIWED